MEKLNENKLAQRITDSEGLKVQTNIAQVKEVLRVALDDLAIELHSGNASGVLELIERHLPKEPYA